MPLTSISASNSNGPSTPASHATPTPQPPFQQTEYTAYMLPQTLITVSTPGMMSVLLTSIPPGSSPIPSTPALGGGTGTPVPAFLNAPSAVAASAPASGGAPSAGVIDPAVGNAKMVEIVKERFDCEGVEGALRRGQKPPNTNSSVGVLADGTEALLPMLGQEDGYWSAQRAAEAEAYVREVVYGGVEGYAYVRNLVEFVDGRTFHEGAKDPDYEADEPLPMRYPSLGMPLAKWAELNVVDPLVEGQHGLLRRTGTELARQAQFGGRQSTTTIGAMEVDTGEEQEPGTIASRVAAAHRSHSYARTALAALQQIAQHKIDMGALIRVPEELFLSEEEWIGKGVKERRRRKLVPVQVQQTKTKAAGVNGAGAADDDGDDEEGDEEDEEGDDAMEVEEEEEEPERTWVGVDADVAASSAAKPATAAAPAYAPPVYEQEGPEELREVLEYVADRLMELDQRNRIRKAKTNGAVENVKSEDTRVGEPAVNGDAAGRGDANGASPAEDAAMRHLRLNLLALAKRAPLDTIARLPKDLVPEHIRNLVPTLGV